MAKRVIWSWRAKEERREILEYWVERTGDKTYSRKLAKVFREKIKFIIRNNYAGTATDIENVRVTVCGNYLFFYFLVPGKVFLAFVLNRQLLVNH